MLLNRKDQIIDEPTHFHRDNIETCIDLILTDQPNYFVHSGIIQSPDPRWKHQMINGKINFAIPCPPPYKRKLWSYKRANIDGIRANMHAINWDEYLCVKSVDDVVFDFTKKFLDIIPVTYLIVWLSSMIEILLGLHQRSNKQSRRIIGCSVSGSRKANQI